MTIFRAIFWLVVVAILMPQERALGGAETTKPDLFQEFKSSTLSRLQQLKDERAAVRNLGVNAHLMD